MFIEKHPLDLEHWLSMTSTTGYKLRDMRLREGHFLVYKIPMAESDHIALPGSFTAKAVQNIVSIKGFVVGASEPWRRKTAKQYWEWDKKQEMELPKYKTITADVATESEIKPGVCILYGSYNVAKVKLRETYTELVIVRECDIMAWWKPEYDDRVSLGDHTMSQSTFEQFPAIEGAGTV